ncbi:MAG: hypothetical protein [Bacteriophage sp.]|nr:MAG: hypothetical protein [Bacteriophage sp.]
MRMNRLAMIIAAGGFAPFATSNADVYASFGVSSAVLSGDNIEDHRQAMLSQDVAVRDHDDSIELRQPQEHDDAGVTVKDLVEDPYATEDDRVEINIPTEGEADQLEVEGEGEQQGEPEGDLGEQLGDVPEALESTTKQIAEYAEGLQSMRDQAIANGLPVESADRMFTEYEENSTLSQASLDELAKAGFAPSFVKSFLQGQESLSTQYVNSIIEYAGGKATFDKLVAHLSANSPETVDVLEDAMNRQDLKAIRATINLAKASHKGKFGTTPARNATARAPASAARAAPKGPEGFSSSEAMVAAMSDPRYGRDEKYRNEVRAKVAASNW